MELEKKIETEKKDELTELQRTNLFNSIVLGKDATEIIETSRGKFKIKFPRMTDLETIGCKVANKLRGTSVMSFDLRTYNLIQEIATLDTLIISGPAWYENAKKESNFTWGDCPLQSFVQEVTAKIDEFRLKVQEQLELPNDESSKSKTTTADNNDDTSGDLFEGMSNK